MPWFRRYSAWIVVALLILQAVHVALVVHRESLTFDEDDHMYAGYSMWHSGDYGLNPEHPPLVKLLAAVPLLGRNLWMPPLHTRDFKAEAYLNGRDWLARNDGAAQHLVFQMRLMAGLLALALSLTVYFAAREWFGPEAALLALLALVFDPNILAHSALVTTDVGVSLFFLASVYAFSRYTAQPTAPRLCVAGVVAGLLLASKHSGILLAPMLILLAVYEVFRAEKNTRLRAALRLTGALAGIVLIAVFVLWSFYGFRYAARPAGLKLSTSLAEYTQPLSPFSASVVLFFAHHHLLPESYLMGLTDVKRMAQFYPTFIFDKVYAHGQWWYFPAVIAIKSTLGQLGLCLLAVLSMGAGLLRKQREVVYLLLPGAVYLFVAMISGMNIGARHILPLYALTAILGGAGLASLAQAKPRWAALAARFGALLLAAHIASSLAVCPNYMAYANEAAGGPRNLHNLLSDANVDWAQQLYQVKDWQDHHPGQECWFAYFANPEIDPKVYGIQCHLMPTLDSFWLGGAEVIPPVIEGNVLISAGDLSGCEWPSGYMNPYRKFQSLQPAESIDHAVFVYQGRFPVEQISALSHAQQAYKLFGEGKAQEALQVAREGASIDPREVITQTARGDIAASLGLKDEARTAWQAALASARNMEPEAQVSYVPDLEAKLKKL